MAEREWDVIIVGGGLAGSALAAVLARDGRRVLVIDRDAQVRPSIKGELLQPGGVRALERMGLDACIKNAVVDAARVDGYVCITPRRGAADVLLTYPSRDPDSFLQQLLGVDGDAGRASPEASGSEAGALAGSGRCAVCPTSGRDLMPRGRSFHNSRFVTSLRAAAAAAGATQVYGVAQQLLTSGEAVEGVLWEPNAAEGAKPAAPREARARLTVVCDGMYSQLRAGVHPAPPPVTVSRFCGLLLHHAPGATPLPYPNRGHVVLVSPAPVLFYQISSVDTRVLVDLPAGVDGEGAGLAAYLRDVVAPQLPQELTTPFLEALASQEPHCMPNKTLPGGAPALSGVVMLGDTLSMRHPLTGGGMTVALRDVELLATCVREVPGSDARALAAAGAAYHARRKPPTINILANALHAVFTSPGEVAGAVGPRSALRAACIAYLARGGACAAGPIGLLAGLSPSPAVLLLHFFSVALFATAHAALTPRPSLSGLARGLAALWVATGIIFPILFAELGGAAAMRACSRRRGAAQKLD